MHALYQIKVFLRQRSCWFWSLIFPIILGTLFYFMFSGISELEMYKEVPIGVIEGAQAAEKDGEASFLEVLQQLELENGQKMFEVKAFKSKEDALEKLKNDEIRGIVDESNDYHMIVKDSASDTTFLKMFVEQYQQNEKMMLDMAKQHPELMQNLVQKLSQGTTESQEIHRIELKGEDKDPYAEYFYALLAMTCLSAGTMGVTIGNRIQANTSALGARRNVAPTPKIRQVTTDFMAGFFLYCVNALIILGVCIFGFGRDFGNNLPMVMLTTFIGSFCGISAGLAIAVCVKGSTKKKDALYVAFYMISSFLAGLQWCGITYYIEKYCPIVNRINPGTLVVMGYKSLAVYGDMTKYWTNVLSLLGIGVLFLAISIGKMRRTQYASI